MLYPHPLPTVMFAHTNRALFRPIYTNTHTDRIIMECELNYCILEMGIKAHDHTILAWEIKVEYSKFVPFCFSSRQIFGPLALLLLN